MKVRARLLALAFPLMRLWWRLRGPGRAVRVAVRHGADVLLVRHSYGPRAWGIPGGGIKCGEDPLLAGVRETAEETGLALDRVASVAGNPVRIGQSELWVYVAETRSREVRIDGVEIAEARWVAVDALAGEELLAQARTALEAAGIRTR